MLRLSFPRHPSPPTSPLSARPSDTRAYGRAPPAPAKARHRPTRHGATAPFCSPQPSQPSRRALGPPNPRGSVGAHRGRGTSPRPKNGMEFLTRRESGAPKIGCKFKPGKRVGFLARFSAPTARAVAGPESGPSFRPAFWAGILTRLCFYFYKPPPPHPTPPHPPTPPPKMSGPS